MAPGDHHLSCDPDALSLEDRAVFARLYEHTHVAVYRYIYALAGGPSTLVEDLTAETYFKAWRGRRGFSGGESAGLGWLLRIARNLVIDAHRKRSRQVPEGMLKEESTAWSGPSPEALLELAEEQTQLLQALQRLPERSRELLALRYVLEWRVKDIAVHMEMAENTVSVALRRALEGLRREWPEQEPPPGTAYPHNSWDKGRREPGTASPEPAPLASRARQSQEPGGSI